MKNYIQKKNSEKKIFRISGIDLEIKEELPYNIEVEKVLNKVTTIIPPNMLRGIKNIKIGNFSELEDRDLDALYKDRTIYLTNYQDSNEDMLDDIVHEVAHSIEERYKTLIYSDNKIKKEFLLKRQKLKEKLEADGFYIEPEKYKSINYDQEFDMFLYKEVGYNTLEPLTVGLFYSPYAATSLREYFANGFENLFIEEESYQVLRKMCPKLFQKLIQLLTLEEEER
jgi:hypothetical protein